MGKANKTRKILAGVLGFVLLLALVLCAACIAAEADHDCTGEDCPVCALVHQCENLLRQFAAAAAAVAVLAAAALLCVPAASCVCAFRYGTPVSCKVRLNN